MYNNTATSITKVNFASVDMGLYAKRKGRLT